MARNEEKPQPRPGLPAKLPKTTDDALVLLAESMDAGHDEATTAILAGLLRMGITPAVIAKETGKSEVVVLSVIGTNPILRQAYQQGRGAQTRRLAIRIERELDSIVETLSDVMRNSESDATRVSAAEALKRFAFETGAVTKAEDDGSQQQVAIGFEGQGRLAVLLGGKKLN